MIGKNSKKKRKSLPFVSSFRGGKQWSNVGIPHHLMHERVVVTDHPFFRSTFDPTLLAILRHLLTWSSRHPHQTLDNVSGRKYWHCMVKLKLLIFKWLGPSKSFIANSPAKWNPSNIKLLQYRGKRNLQFFLKVTMYKELTMHTMQCIQYNACLQNTYNAFFSALADAM